MTKQELIDKRARMKQQLEYLWTNQAMEDEALMRFIPSMSFLVVACLIFWAAMSCLFYYIGDLDLLVAVKIGLCFCVIFLAFFSLVLRERAYASAFDIIMRRRKRMMCDIEKIDFAIKEYDRDLVFVPLD